MRPAGPGVPRAVLELKESIRQQVEEFFQVNRPEDSCLVLDSTGPCLTKHYLVLKAIGLERLKSFRKVHAFSGGVWAYFGFLALETGMCNLAFADFLQPGPESAMRRIHHRNWYSPLDALWGLLVRKTAFGSSEPVRAMIDYYLRRDFYMRTLEGFPAGLNIYIGVGKEPVPMRVNPGRAALVPGPGGREVPPDTPLIDLIEWSIKVPFVYGNPGGRNAFFDAVYTPGYATTVKAASSSGIPTLVSTPWRKGRKREITFLNCFGTEYPKLKMGWDFARLVLNIPNRDYGHDVVAAFLL